MGALKIACMGGGLRGAGFGVGVKLIAYIRRRVLVDAISSGERIVPWRAWESREQNLARGVKSEHIPK